MMGILFNRESKSGGGLGNGTVLWENPNPTASFAQNLLTLSAELSQFSFIGLKFRVSTTNDTEFESIARREDFDKATGSATEPTAGTPQLAIGSRYSGTGARCTWKVSETQITIAGCFNAGGGTVNTVNIPLQIIGY